MTSLLKNLMGKPDAGNTDEIGVDELKSLKDDIERLQEKLATYKHAFETTTADRDRLATELDKANAELYQIAVPLDAGFFRFDFEHFDNKAAEARGLAADWQDKFEKGQYAGIIESVLDDVPVKKALPSSQPENKSLAAYYLACLLTRQMRLGEATQYTEHFYYTAPPEGADFLPYDLKQASRLAYYRRTMASLRGQPGLIISSMPKSASAFLSYSLAELLNVPVLRASMGDGMRALVVDRWAKEISSGGAVTHEHVTALPENLAALNRADVETVWLQIRDPRDCAYSLWKMRQSWFSDRKSPITEIFTDHGYSKEEDIFFLMSSIRFSQWISDWLNAAADRKVKFSIEFVTFDEVTTDLPKVLRRMLDSAYSEDFAASVHALVSRFESEQSQPLNFRKGKGNEWRESFSPKILEDVYEKMHDNTKEFLNLKP